MSVRGTKICVVNPVQSGLECAQQFRGGFSQSLGLEIDSDGVLIVLIANYVDESSQVFTIAVFDIFGLFCLAVGCNGGRLVGCRSLDAVEKVAAFRDRYVRCKVS